MGPTEFSKSFDKLTSRLFSRNTVRQHLYKLLGDHHDTYRHVYSIHNTITKGDENVEDFITMNNQVLSIHNNLGNKKKSGYRLAHQNLDSRLKKGILVYKVVQCVPTCSTRSFVQCFALCVGVCITVTAGNSVQGQLGFSSEFESYYFYTNSAPFFQASFKDSCQGFQDNGSARGQLMHAETAARA